MKKIILEFKAYTDEWGYERSMFQNYISKYFENPVYEYTDITETRTNIRRVFDYSHAGINAVSDILEKLMNSTYGKDSVVDEISEHLCKAIFDVNKAKAKTDKNKDVKCYVWYDGCSEMEISIYTIETDAKEIKRIIYKD